MIQQSILKRLEQELQADKVNIGRESGYIGYVMPIGIKQYSYHMFYCADRSDLEQRIICMHDKHSMGHGIKIYGNNPGLGPIAYYKDGQIKLKKQIHL